MGSKVSAMFRYVKDFSLTRLFRLKKAHPNVNSFYKRLLVHSLATQNPGELRDSWLFLAKLCQEQKVDAGKAILNILDVNGADQPVSSSCAETTAQTSLTLPTSTSRPSTRG